MYTIYTRNKYMKQEEIQEGHGKEFMFRKRIGRRESKHL
jgi:hypothetical protein